MIAILNKKARLPYGKYKGLPVNEVMILEPTYMNWFVTVYKGKIDKGLLKQLNKRSK